MGIFLSNLGGSVSVLDLTDGQQCCKWHSSHSGRPLFNRHTYPAALVAAILLPAPAAVAEHQEVAGHPVGAAVPTLSGHGCDLRSLAKVNLQPLVLIGHERRPATGSFLWGIEKGKMMKMEKSLKFLLTWKNSIINEIYKNHSFKFFLI